MPFFCECASVGGSRAMGSGSPSEMPTAFASVHLSVKSRAQSVWCFLNDARSFCVAQKVKHMVVGARFQGH